MNQAPKPVPARRLISRRSVVLLRDTSLSTEKRLEREDPAYPVRIQLTPGSVRWWEDEILAYSNGKRLCLE